MTVTEVYEMGEDTRKYLLSAGWRNATTEPKYKIGDVVRVQFSHGGVKTGAVDNVYTFGRSGSVEYSLILDCEYGTGFYGMGSIPEPDLKPATKKQIENWNKLLARKGESSEMIRCHLRKL